MRKKYFQRGFRYTEEDEELLERFGELVKNDKEIVNSIKEEQRKKVLKNGLFSHAVKELIRDYVNVNWGIYSRKLKMEMSNGN